MKKKKVFKHPFFGKYEKGQRFYQRPDGVVYGPTRMSNKDVLIQVSYFVPDIVFPRYRGKFLRISFNFLIIDKNGHGTWAK